MQLILRIPELVSLISLRVTVTFNVALRDGSYNTSQWTSWSSSPFKAALALIAVCEHPGIWGILRGNGGKRTGCDATNRIAECWSSRQGLSGCTSDPTLPFFLLALFSVQPRSGDYFLCIATFTFGWSFLSQLKKGNLIDAGIHVYMGHVLITQGCKWAEMFSSCVCAACCSVYRSNCSIWIFHSFCTELSFFPTLSIL